MTRHSARTRRQQFLDCPNVVRHSGGHCGRYPQRAVNPNEIVMAEIQPQSRREILDALAESVSQPRQSSQELLAFHTGLMAFDYYRFPPPPFVGNGWHLDLVLPGTDFPIGSARAGDESYPAKEVVVRATSEVKAQRAAGLVHSARLLLEGSNLLSQIYPGEHAPIHVASTHSGTALNQAESEFLARTGVMTVDIPLACMVAARASARLEYIYALAKLRLSLETYSLPVIALDPFHSQNVPKSPLPEDHVRMAFAIVAAWSCIEEMGFEIRASNTKPSKLPDGRWNPEVRSELEARLRKGHINLNEPIHWNLRGPRTRIEKKRKPVFIQKAPWARYRVRDGKMEVIEAIHYVSFLRSWVAAHKTDKRMVRMLSVYDVANAQLLARRLFLEKMGFWRYLGDEGKKVETAVRQSVARQARAPKPPTPAPSS